MPSEVRITTPSRFTGSGPKKEANTPGALIFNGSRLAEGKGASKKLAEMQAAKKGLQKLKEQEGK